MSQAARLDRAKILLPLAHMVAISKHITALREITAHGIIKLPQMLQLIMASRRMAGWTMTDITSATGAKPSAVTMAKNKLTKEALVVEHSPQRDRRMTKIYLTKLGREKAGEMWGALRALVSAEKAIRLLRS